MIPNEFAGFEEAERLPHPGFRCALISKVTTPGKWTCPDCGLKNDLNLIAGVELPERLRCLDCGHISPKLEWTAEKKEQGNDV